MELSDLNNRQRKALDVFSIEMNPLETYLPMGKIFGAGKLTIQSLVELGLLNYSPTGWRGYDGWRITIKGMETIHGKEAAKKIISIWENT